ncbi:MAG: glycosyltransferase family 2 protein [Paludibacteraceae bacterium]|nr:glycosyltransferase family 2 protein [Paludibacteraceae bacterium]
MQNKLVSIITPVYNGSKFISQTIDSVLMQTYEEWEMIIIDDGSTDNSSEIVLKYTQKDSRIRLLSQKNAGSAAARNNGIREAGGRYIALLDADDLWEPFFLEEQLALMQCKGCLLVYGSHKRIDEHNNECLKPFYVHGSVDYGDLLKTCSISCLTGLYDTSVYGKFYLREDLKSLRDDYLYWLEIIKKVKIAYANTNLIASYRIIGDSVSRNKKKVIKPQFRIYYEIEKLGIIKSVYYLICWAVNGFMKYRK